MQALCWGARLYRFHDESQTRNICNPQPGRTSQSWELSNSAPLDPCLAYGIGHAARPGWETPGLAKLGLRAFL